VAVIRHGRLIATLLLDAQVDADAVDRAVTPVAPEVPAVPPTPQEREEIGLVLRYLDQPDVRLHRASGSFCLPITAGRQLADLDAEARRVDRAVRRDGQTLRGDKVQRRVG